MIKSSRRSVVSIRAVAMITIAVLSMLPASPANATNFGSECSSQPRPTCTSMANNKWHAVRFSNLGGQIPGIDDAVQWALTNVYNPTDLIAYRDEGDPYPDVWVHDSNYGPNGLLAWADCPSDNTGTGGGHPNRWCRGQDVAFNEFYDYLFTTYGILQNLACHELGHTVGLRHTVNVDSCMHDDGFYVVGLNNHDRAHINARY